jgi:hypothetical protein
VAVFLKKKDSMQTSDQGVGVSLYCGWVGEWMGGWTRSFSSQRSLFFCACFHLSYYEELIQWSMGGRDVVDFEPLFDCNYKSLTTSFFKRCGVCRTNAITKSYYILPYSPPHTI